MTEDNKIISLSNDQLKLYYNEYMRRYRNKNKNKVSDYNKKYNQKRNNNTTKDKTKNTPGTKISRSKSSLDIW